MRLADGPSALRRGGSAELFRSMTAAEIILEMPTRNKNDFADEIAVRVSPATVIRHDEPLARHSTLRVGGPADVYVEPASEADLAGVVKFCNARGGRPRSRALQRTRHESRRGKVVQCYPATKS